MTKKKLESELGAAYRLRPGEVRDGGRVVFERRRECVHGSWWRPAGEDAPVHSRQRPSRLLQRRRRLLQRGRSIRADAVEEPDSVRQVDIGARRALRGSASAFL